ncbi:MAG: hypothetical protein IKO86_08035 [Prevotella sp.]|nr:hypothetical protein [Prevotella sp.]
MKKLLPHKYYPWLLTVLFGLAVFLFWKLRYPFALTYQEQLQLFLFDGDYFCDRMAEPGGFARYVAEFLVQFYNGVAIGAAIIALLYMLIQRLTWRLISNANHPLSYVHYPLSFIPVVMLWFAMGDESVMLTYVVALAMALAMTVGLRRVMRDNRDGRISSVIRWGGAIVLIPVLYWLTGPMVVLVALLMLPWTLTVAAVVYTLALILLSAHFLPFPMMRVVLGISYYRIPVTIPYILMAIPLVILLLTWISRKFPKVSEKNKPWVLAGELLVVAMAGMLIVPRGFDARKYELIEYDYLVRIQDWNGIIAKAEKKMPDLPMSVCATNLALAMTNQLGDRAFDFYQHGSEGLLPKFERNFATTQLTGEVYFNLGLVNTAQRFAFEAMEAIPNYNKSARVVKRLAETNLINGQYKVAEKYLRMLEKTIFYRPWAQRTIAMLGDEKAIDAHPLYGTLRQYRLQEDFLFSDRELDKICGRLFLHNTQNQMAAQYLLMMPLMDRDIPLFMQYVQVVQTRQPYNPRAVQEGIAFAFMQQRQQPPKGVVSQYVLQQMNEFGQAYGNNKSAAGLNRFRNTVWYYLTIGER